MKQMQKSSTQEIQLLPKEWQPKYVLKRIEEKDITIDEETRVNILRGMNEGVKYMQIGQYTIMLSTIKAIEPLWTWEARNIPPKPEAKYSFNNITREETLINREEIELWWKTFFPEEYEKNKKQEEEEKRYFEELEKRRVAELEQERKELEENQKYINGNEELKALYEICNFESKIVYVRLNNGKIERRHVLYPHFIEFKNGAALTGRAIFSEYEFLVIAGDKYLAIED